MSIDKLARSLTTQLRQTVLTRVQRGDRGYGTGGEASPAPAWTAAEPLVSRHNEKGRVVGELEVPPAAAGFGLDERVRVPAASLKAVIVFFQRDHGDGVLLVRVRREVCLLYTSPSPRDRG